MHYVKDDRQDQVLAMVLFLIEKHHLDDIEIDAFQKP
jgi:hypothetical protein